MVLYQLWRGIIHLLITSFNFGEISKEYIIAEFADSIRKTEVVMGNVCQVK
jgi:hypothetical protein